MPRGCCARLVDALFCRCFPRSDSGVDGDLGEGQQYDLSLNVGLTGECGVGKTSLRNRWVDGVFTGDVGPTFGVDFNCRTVDLVRDNGSPPRQAVEPSTGHDNDDDDADLKVKINIYDTSGKPRYREVNSGYMLSFDAMVCVYDISARQTLNDLRRYFDDHKLRERFEERRKAGMAMILVGNKCELPLSERQVGSQTGQDVAAELGVPFMEVSAKSGANVDEAFMAVVTKAVGEHLAREDRKSGGAGVSQKRTGKEKGGLQRAWRTKASTLDLFNGATTPVLKTEPEALLLASPTEEEEETTYSTFPAAAIARPVKVTMGARSEGTVTADAKGNDPSIRNGDDRCPLLTPRPCSPPTRIPDTRGAAPAAKQCSSGFREHHHPLPTFEISGSSATRKLISPAAAAAGGREDRSGSRSLVHSGGHREVGEGRTSPGRRGVSPIGRASYPHTTSSRGGETGTSRSRPSSLSSPRRSRGPVHFSPRAQLSAGRDASPSPRGGGRSLFAKVDESVITSASAATSLRKLSSFWLDQWGIKEARTDANRQRRARIRIG